MGGSVRFLRLTNSTDDDSINLDAIVIIWKDGSSIKFRAASVDSTQVINYNDDRLRDKDFDLINSKLNSKKESNYMDDLKEYFNKHKDVIMTVSIVVLIDFFVLDGAFTGRIKALVEKMLGSLENKLVDSGETKDVTPV